MTYDIDYFIKFFTSKPRNTWLVGSFVNDSSTKFCALGHLGCRVDGRDNALGIAFCDLFPFGTNITSINNNTDGNYTNLGRHPRTRILNALKRIKKGKSLYG